MDKIPSTDKQNTTKEATQKAPIKSKKNNHFLLYIAFFASLIAMAEGTLVLIQTYLQQNSHIQATQWVNKLNENYLTDKKNFHAQLQFVKDNVATLTSSKKNQDEKVQLLEDKLGELLKEQQDNQSYFAINKANYLMQLAQLSLQFNQPLTPAITLLESADNLLKSTNATSLVKVRQLLNAEITALKTTPSIDTAGMLSKLSALANKMPSLPLKNEHPRLENQKETTQKTQPGWKGYLNKSLSTLKSLVVIRYRNKPLAPLLAPKEKKLLSETIALNLHLAQWAIIHKDKALYQFNLNQASELITTHFSSNDNQTLATLETLNKLKSIDIAPPLPDIGQSQTVLQHYIDQQNKEAYLIRRR